MFQARKKVLLVRPAYSGVYRLFGRAPRDREVRPPLGLLSLAGSLRAAGHQVEVLDGEPDRLGSAEIVARVLRADPDVLGVTSTTPEIHVAQAIVAGAKAARPRLMTVLGGAHASALPEETLEGTPGLDYLVVGEGERALVELIDSPPRERILRPAPIEKLDDLPMPARDLVDGRRYRFAAPGEGLVWLDAVETSRGCPFECSFCFHLPQSKTRYKSPERVLDELKDGRRHFNSQMVVFFDDTFTLARRRVRTLLQMIRDSGLGLKFHCFTRADTLSPEIAGLMAEARFVKATIGVESGSQAVLDRVGKGTRLQHYRDAFRLAARGGHRDAGQLHRGHPPRDVGDGEGVDRLRAHAWTSSASASTSPPPTRAPGSTSRRWPRTGSSSWPADWRLFCRWGSSVVRTPAMSAREIEEAQQIFLTEFYSSPKVVRYHLGRLLNGNHSFFYYRPVMWSLLWRHERGTTLRRQLVVSAGAGGPVLLLCPPGRRIYQRDNYCSHESKASYYWYPYDLVVQSGFLSERGPVDVLDATALRLYPERALDAVERLRPRAVFALTGAVCWRDDEDFLDGVVGRTGAARLPLG